MTVLEAGGCESYAIRSWWCDSEGTIPELTTTPQPSQMLNALCCWKASDTPGKFNELSTDSPTSPQQSGLVPTKIPHVQNASFHHLHIMFLVHCLFQSSQKSWKDSL